MGKKLRLLANEKGSTLIITMLIMVILTIVSVALSNTSRTEIQIAANDHFYRMAFHNADSGINITSKLFKAFFEENFDGTPLPIIFPDDDSEEAFREEALGFDLPDAGKVGSVQVVVDEEYCVIEKNQVIEACGVTAEVDFLERRHTIGSEVNTSLSFIYDMETWGEGPKNSVANIQAVYRHVEKI